jgi:hypothetical protein
MLVRLGCIAAAAAYLSSCPPSVHVTPAGSLQTGVEFRLSDGISGGTPPFQVVLVTVLRKETDTTSLVIWELQGDAVLYSIRYGAKYKGLKEARRPERLRPGYLYDVDVSARGASGFSGFGHFKIDEAGNVIDTYQ